MTSARKIGTRKEGKNEDRRFKIRVMDCDCGLHIDRDQNAAINIRNEGLRLLSEVA